MTPPQAQVLMTALGSVDLKTLPGSAKVELTRVLIALRPLARKLDDARQDALERLTEGHDEQQLLERLYQNDKKLTTEETEKAREWEKELGKQLNEALKDIQSEEDEVTLTPLTDKALANIYDALPNLTAADMMYIQDLLGNEVVIEEKQ